MGLRHELATAGGRACVLVSVLSNTAGVLVLVSVLSNWRKLELFEKRESQLRKFLHKIGLWSSLWYISLISD